MCVTVEWGGDCSGVTNATDCIDPEPGRYLVALLTLTSGGDRRATTAEVSDELGVEAPSTTEMLGKLTARSLVDHRNYRGTTLTDRGETIARELHWRQRVVRSFFASELDLRLDSEKAYRIGYTLPRTAVEELASLNARPARLTDNEVPTLPW